jgi:2-polyprenyl-3-methyl-5-hydroxy-6-metoxy-1,4-benzoquinol methylase
MIALMEHPFNQKHVMTEVKRALKPEGVVVITTPAVSGNDIVLRLALLWVYSPNQSWIIKLSFTTVIDSLL